MKTEKFKNGQKTTKSADVTSNDPARPKIKLAMSGSVKRVLDWVPTPAQYEALAGRPIVGDLELVVPSGVTLDLVDLTATGKLLTLSPLQPIEPGKRWKVTLSAPATEDSTAKKENLTARVKLDTPNGVRDMKIPVPIQLRHTDRIQFEPKESVSFPKKETASLGSPDAKPLQRTVSISSGDPEISYHVTKAELVDVPPGLFEAEVREVTPGSKYAVVVTLKEKVAQKFVRGKLLIHTDDPSAPKKEMRLFAQFDVPK